MTTIELTTPILNGEEIIATLTFKEPTVGDLMAMDKAKGDMEKSLLLLCALTDLTVPVAKQITLKDLNNLINPVLMDFLADSPATGNG